MTTDREQIFKNARKGFWKAAAVVFVVYGSILLGAVSMFKDEEIQATICCLKGTSPGVRDSGMILVLAKTSGGSEISVQWSNQLPILKGKVAKVIRRTNKVTGNVTYAVVGYVDARQS
ncbi:hypothetical protein HBA55_34790 [Pseudomaricurvus alkylphenolicus]|uniref:hypothetical protein n=1 Tax=Pseudomaricurvus alkylphenolicus TaxID=1306991 RepID=UPI00141E9D45|nr:hypothetical protein [Pseudomaricurvus alkylphenolicus]NIB44800.1 hypothetical protein [Pseudomaricurvus alkylphenolicus]